MFGSDPRTQSNPAAPLPVDAATLYPEDDGFFGRRAKKGREKLLAGIGDLLRLALAPGETIRYAARGCRYGVLEYMFSGNAARYHNLVALVVTDRRVLMIHLTGRGKPADIKNQIPLSEIRRVGSKAMSLGWSFELADGTRERFISVARRDRKVLEAMLGNSAPPSARPPGRPSLEPLCPACLQPVPVKVGTQLACPNPVCRIPYRDPKKAAKLSALVPGLGDLYLRHHLFGSFEFLGSMLLLGIGVMFVADAIAAPEPSKAITAGVMLLFFLVGPRIVDYFVTLHMGRKGLVPLALAPAPGAQARNLPSFPAWSPLLFLAGLAIAGGVAFGLGQDLGRDGAVREASRLAKEGKFDEALARWEAIVASGEVSDERKVRFALALMEAGDLKGMDAIRVTFGENAKVETELADRWNKALELEQAALADHDAGVKAFLEGDEEGLARLDRSLAYFAQVKRPHVPATRAELSAHLAASVLAPPIERGNLERADELFQGAADAPAIERAIVTAALAALRHDPAAAGALAKLDLSAAPPEFRLLALEQRLLLAATDAERDEVRKAAGALRRADCNDAEAERLDALLKR